MKSLINFDPKRLTCFVCHCVIKDRSRIRLGLKLGGKSRKIECIVCLFIQLLSGLLINRTPDQRCNRSGFSRPDPTGKFQNHRRLTGPVDQFFTEGFCSLFNVSNEKFLKGGAWLRS